MEYIAFVTALAILEYAAFSGLTGRARSRFGVAAPAVSGNENFERYFRVQQNTLEQLMVFVPSLWLFGYYVNGPIGALLGVVFLVGRVLYFRGYTRDPAKRGLGFLLAGLARRVCFDVTQPRLGERRVEIKIACN